MAEFAEVCKQYRRMCAANYGFEGKKKGAGLCTGCELDKYTNCTVDAISALGKISEYEKIIMTWAAENPELVYPTWIEWLLGGINISNGCVTNMWLKIRLDDGTTIKVYGHIVTITSTDGETRELSPYTSIPADIAAILGVEPVKEK